MCGHAFMFHARDHWQRHSPRRQCGTCGRVASVPLDCCTRPDLTRLPPAELTRRLSQGISRWRRWTLARVRLLWGWQRHPAIRVGTTKATTSPPNI